MIALFENEWLVWAGKAGPEEYYQTPLPIGCAATGTRNDDEEGSAEGQPRCPTGENLLRWFGSARESHRGKSHLFQSLKIAKYYFLK